METSPCRRLHGFILLLVMFFPTVFSLASTIDVSIHGDRKRILSGSTETYTMCAEHSEANDDGMPIPLNFDCKKGYVMSKINFADYGQSTGSCGKFKRGKCGASNTLDISSKR